jgi:hypothetical protein
MCYKHVVSCVTEYREKLGEQWHYEVIEPWQS